MYETKNRDGRGCGEGEGSSGKCRQGDLGGKFGKVRVGRRESMFTKAYHTDLDLELPDLDGTRSLFVAIYDAEHPDRFEIQIDIFTAKTTVFIGSGDKKGAKRAYFASSHGKSYISDNDCTPILFPLDSFLACARLRGIETKVARAAFTHQGVAGDVEFSQVSPFHPVSTRVSLSGLDGGAGGFHVHEFPVPRRMGAEDNPCARTAGHFNPFNADKSVSPAAGEGGYDEYEVGDLSGKVQRNSIGTAIWGNTHSCYNPYNPQYGGLAGVGERRDGFVDPSLSLFGRYSVVGRYVFAL